MSRFLNSKTEWIFALLLFAAVYFLSSAFQTPIAANDHKGYDGLSYYELTSDLCLGRQPHNENGYFLRRLGTPFLASLVSCSDIIGAFKKVNGIANLLITLLLLLWFRRLIASSAIRLLMLGLFITQWHAPLRWTAYYPVQTDSTSFIFILLGLIGLDMLMKNIRSLLGTFFIYLSAILGAWFRENIILITLSYPFVGNFLWDKQHWQKKSIVWKDFFYWLPFILMTLMMVFETSLVIGNRSTLSETALRLLLRRPITLYLFAWIIAFGPILLLPFFYFKDTRQFFKDRQPLFIYFILGCGLSYACGYDIERYIYWLMPVIYGLIGILLEKYGAQLKQLPVFVTLLSLGQMMNHRIFWVVPQDPNPFPHRFPIFTVWGNHFPMPDLFATYASTYVALVSSAQYGLLFILLILIYSWEKNRKAI